MKIVINCKEKGNMLIIPSYDKITYKNKTINVKYNERSDKIW